ncbi:MAG: hypothetical protein KGO83_00565 [Paenibacillaceae bacterium]|jgi:hypothetical protein|nr:hypothetical protein [Paenibacillaceae bacterium]
MMQAIISAMHTMAHALAGSEAVWLLGGSSALAMRGIALAAPPRDVDVYADEMDVHRIANELQQYVVKPAHYSATALYASTRVLLRMHGVDVEIVGDLTVTTPSSRYTVRVRDVLMHDAELCHGIPLMPLAHEYVFNVLRARQDRVDALEARMGEDCHRAVVQRLIATRSWIMDSHRGNE